jgi:hypothetical protein
MAAFDTYEVIATRNVHLDDESIVKGIRMASIIVEAFMRGKFNQIRIRDVFHMPKL